jgi:transposase
MVGSHGGDYMKPYSLDLRQRAIEAYNENPNACEVARRFDVSHTWVQNLVKLWRQTGSLEPQYQNCGRSPTIGEREKQWLREWLAEENGLTLKELQERLAEKGVTVSHATVDNALKSMNITRKKKRQWPKNKSVPMSKKSAGAGTAKQ